MVLSPKEWRVWAPQGALQIRRPMSGRGVSITSGFVNQQWLYLREIRGYGRQILFLKSLCTNSLPPRSNVEAAVWKVLGPYMEKWYWLTLGQVLEGHWLVGTLSGDGSTSGHNYFFVLSLCSPSTWLPHCKWEHLMCNSPLTWLTLSTQLCITLRSHTTKPTFASENPSQAALEQSHMLSCLSSHNHLSQLAPSLAQVKTCLSSHCNFPKPTTSDTQPWLTS